MTPFALAADFGGRLPGTLLSWGAVPWPAVPTSRDEALTTAVGAGGALLVFYAAWAHTAHRATVAQVRGAAGAGAGFLLTAYASSSLRIYHVLGPVVSMVGVGFVFRASVALVRDRQDARRRGPPVA